MLTSWICKNIGFKVHTLHPIGFANTEGVED